ncbi:MAG TPA: thymidine phosphorylase, partial [Chloroflexi bacterium]|nr:thymidine phosphorylase [Chloroflexota bacterium]
AVDIIAKKRDGGELTREELHFFIQGYTRGDIPDYQAAAWLMAVYLRGMSRRETVDLTLEMAHSGDILDLSDIAPVVVDKHSTGGVGDKTTLVVAPVVAAAGLPVGKMTGRGLGFSGGTLDKLESVRGYRSDLTTAEFLDQLRRIGIVLTGQSLDLAPADGKLYALRDVTATVSSLPLIASSVMSKKLASGAHALVLDVKVGRGAFMRTLEEARALAEMMVNIGRDAGRRVTALLSDMNQPLGWAVGNALELREAIDVLHEGGPPDFREHCLVVASEMLLLGGKVQSEEEGIALAAERIASGAAWQKFRQLIEAQGGDVSQVDDPEKLPQARYVEAVSAPRSGYLAAVDAREVGMTAVLLGAGREKKGDPVDHAVGIIVHYKVGDYVEAGTPLFTIHANDPQKLALARERLLAAHRWSDEPVEPLPLFYQKVTDGP